MSDRLWTDRSGVYIVRAENGFLPSSPWNFPREFTEGKMHTINIPLEDARALVRCLNKGFMADRAHNPEVWDHLWAIVLACPRSKGWDKHIRVVSCSQTKGGAI